MKNYNMNVLCFALPFILGCSTVSANTPSKTWGQALSKSEARIETFSQLESASSAVKPKWLRVTPQSNDGFYFVGMSSKRTEPRDARNESFNDALIGFARYCGLNVQYLAEHRDRSVGGNGGLIDTWTEGNTVAKMQAEMHLGNVSTEDRYTEKYSSFYGGSFMGYTFVDATLVFVPHKEMKMCRENREQANTFIAQKATEVSQLTSKNESLQTQNELLKKQNTNLASVAMSQAHNSAEFFKQAGYSKRKQPTKKVTNFDNKDVEKVVSNKKPVVKTFVDPYPTEDLSIGRIHSEEYATWRSGGEDFMIKLFDVNFGVRHYNYFAFKLERGHGNGNEIILGNFNHYCDKPPCWDASLPGNPSTGQSGYPFNKSTFEGMSEDDRAVLLLLASNLPRITSQAVAMPMYRTTHLSHAAVTQKTGGYGLTETEQNEWSDQAFRMASSFK
jgi:hypothetical protein